MKGIPITGAVVILMKESMPYVSLENAVRVIGGRWRITILASLLLGTKRFNQLQKDIGISRRMLTVNLRALEEAGLILRTAYPEIPPRVEYQLTQDGLELRSIIDDLSKLEKKLIERQKMNEKPTVSAFAI